MDMLDEARRITVQRPDELSRLRREIRDAHEMLDLYNAPRTHPDDGTCALSLFGRIHLLAREMEREG